MMKGENVLIYGATGGIGRALVDQLLRAGANVYAIGRSRERLKNLTTDFNLSPAHLLCAKTLTNEIELEKLMDRLQGVRFRFAIHAAGQGLIKTAANLRISEWNDIIDINLTSAFAFFKLFSALHTSDHYELVFFSSASISQAWPKNSLYGASKAGLEAFAQSLQKEIKADGGRVWLYRAGSVRTGFFNAIKQHIPLDKMLPPEQIANLVIGNFSVPPGIYFPVIHVLSE